MPAERDWWRYVEDDMRADEADRADGRERDLGEVAGPGDWWQCGVCGCWNEWLFDVCREDCEWMLYLHGVFGPDGAGTDFEKGRRP